MGCLTWVARKKTVNHSPIMFLRFVQRGDVGNPILLALQMKGDMMM